MKKFFKEFKEFALKGNVISLAVGVMIGSAFQAIVTSLTTNILSPLIGLFMRQNFDKLELELLGTTIQYGAFITAVVNFVILALVVFLMVKAMNRLLSLGQKKQDGAADPAPTDKECPYCLTKIPKGATRCPACTSVLEQE